jgi:hypothetical protein
MRAAAALGGCEVVRRVDNGAVRRTNRLLWVAGLAAAGAGGGYAYLVRVLQPVPPTAACPRWEFSYQRCLSYDLIVSKPFFLIAGALIGVWLGYAAVRLHTVSAGRSFTLGEALVVGPPLLAICAWIISVRPAWVVALHPGTAWIGSGPGPGEILIFFGLAILARLMIGIASVAKVRGSLILACGLPIVFAGLGYAFIVILRQPPVWHECPAMPHESPQAVAAACTYHPVIGEIWPWIFLGLLAGTWLAFAIALDVASPLPRTMKLIEVALAVPAIAVAIWWALAIGPQQGGGGYVGLFVLLVALTALLRLLVGAGPIRRASQRLGWR